MVDSTEKPKRGRPKKYDVTALNERRQRLRSYFDGMKDEIYSRVLSGDKRQVAAALRETFLSDFMDRPDALAGIIVEATGDEQFPRKYRGSQALFFADAIIAHDAGTSVRYLRRFFRRERKQDQARRRNLWRQRSRRKTGWPPISTQ